MPSRLTPALGNVIANLQMLYASADTVARTSDPIRAPRVAFIEPEPIWFVAELGGHLFEETGLLALRAGDGEGNVLQIHMMKEQARVLYNILLDVFATDDKAN